MKRQEVLSWLFEEDEARLTELWRQADATRRAHVGEVVHLRGLIEISNYCARACHYCGLRAPNAKLQRYRMKAEEILACAAQAVKLGYGTVVLQAGEDAGLTEDLIVAIIRQIKRDMPLAVTLSLGERTDEDLAAWRYAGADRYLLRFETSNAQLYGEIHPPLKNCGLRNADCGLNDNNVQREEPTRDSELRTQNPRFALLRRLRDLGYEIGSGVMIGIPGQSYDDLANDLEAFVNLDLEMIGMGPFLPHPATPLGNRQEQADATGAVQWSMVNGQSSIPHVPNTELMTYKMIALARLMCPDANIPSTTALATINKAQGRELGLQRGANVVMPNLTPVEYRAMYEIYPAKACIFETADQCHACLNKRIESIGRSVGTGRGDSPRHVARHAKV